MKFLSVFLCTSYTKQIERIEIEADTWLDFAVCITLLDTLKVHALKTKKKPQKQFSWVSCDSTIIKTADWMLKEKYKACAA